MSQLRFKIYNQIITRVDNFIPVDGSENYLHAEFDFETNEWAGLTKTAQFRRGERETVYEVILQNDACEVPHEVLKNNGTRRVLVTVFAGSLVTANSAEVFMTPTGYDDDAESSEPPTPSVYEQIIELMENKVDKIPGKGLSTEDFTTADKTKLEGIEPGAEENVIDTIKVNGTELEPEDKAVDITVPTKTSQLDNDSDYVSDSNYVHTDNNFTDADESKLDGIEPGAEVNVNPDWDATSGDAEIKNKPTTLAGYGITDAYTKTQADGLLSAKADASSVYTKSEVDTALAGKANASTVYTKTETDTLLDGKVDKVQGKGLSTEDFTTAEKNKLDGIQAGAEVNQNAFSKVKVGNTTIEADSKTDTLELAGGTAIAITPDATNDKATVSHDASGITAGTYRSVTVDAQGHATAGTNPTTRDGYGLTDVYTKAEVSNYSEGSAGIHGGFYIDSDGDLCQL